MNLSKLFPSLILLTKNLVFVFALLLVLVTFKGCFEEDQHCQSETHESRIWTPECCPAVASWADGRLVEFKFERSSGYKGYYSIENSCPFGVINYKVTIVEKPGAYPKPAYYLVSLFREIYARGKVIPVLIKEQFVEIRTGTEFWAQQTVLLTGSLQDGPINYRISCKASFVPELENALKAEEWAKNNIIKVVYEANYVRW